MASYAYSAEYREKIAADVAAEYAAVPKFEGLPWKAEYQALVNGITNCGILLTQTGFVAARCDYKNGIATAATLAYIANNWELLHDSNSEQGRRITKLEAQVDSWKDSTKDAQQSLTLAVRREESLIRALHEGGCAIVPDMTRHDGTMPDGVANRRAEELERRFTEHTAAVGAFLKELWATSIDPVEDCELKVQESLPLLLEAARKNRELLVQRDEELRMAAADVKAQSAVWLENQSRIGALTEQLGGSAEELRQVRMALFKLGHCGDGRLGDMVSRALGEAKEEGRREMNDVADAMQAASACFPEDWEGTVADRIKRLQQDRRESVSSEAVILRELYVKDEPGFREVVSPLLQRDEHYADERQAALRLLQNIAAAIATNDDIRAVPAASMAAVNIGGAERLHKIWREACGHIESHKWEYEDPPTKAAWARVAEEHAPGDIAALFAKVEALTLRAEKAERFAVQLECLYRALKTDRKLLKEKP